MKGHSCWTAVKYGTRIHVHIIRELREGWVYCIASVDANSIWPMHEDSRWIEVVW